ncbi:triose phosphate isomerase [Lactarius deliciosus]|nr:triose phosphate isomerase [Lactarius deliciosus]
MTRQFFVGGNFKMNPVSREAKRALIKTLNDATLHPETEVVIAPPSLYLIPVLELLRKDVKVSAQNCHTKTSGAFTGETSPAQLADAGIPYVILGHSERRTLFGETRVPALDAGLRVILCVGETLTEREGGRTQQVVEEQLQAVVALLKPEDWRFVVALSVFAYEPVWAIGTGKAQEVHAATRKYLASAVSPVVAESTRIIYGGSVTAANSKELAGQPDVDGFLVGGASLKPEFVNIVNARAA